MHFQTTDNTGWDLEYLLPREAARDAFLKSVTQGPLSTRARARDTVWGLQVGAR